MDIGTIFVGIVLLVLAWAAWTYLPHPLGVLVGLVLGLVGLYFLIVGLIGGMEGEHVGLMLPAFLTLPRLRRLLR